MILIFEKPAAFWVAAIIFKIFLEISYVQFVSPVFAYAGFYYDLDYIKYIEGWLIFLLLLKLSPKKLLASSDYFLNFLLFSYLAPLIAYYGLTSSNREHLFLVLLSVGMVYFFRAGLAIKVPYIKNGKLIASILIYIGIFSVTAWMIYSGGLRYFNLDLTRVYDFGRDVGEVINEGVMGYLNVWATKVFGPILLAISLWRKKFFIAFIVFLLHLVWFGISSHKSVLFYPFLVTFLWIWFGRTRALSLVPFAMTLAVFAALMAYLIFDDEFTASMIIRRVYFVPAYLTFTYYDFFSQNDFVYWSNSILSSFVSYPYDVNTALLIGEHLGTDASANNSFLSTGYMHAGVFGVIFYGVLVGFLFRLIDSLSIGGVPSWVSVATLIVPIQALLVSADLPTSLLTHGIGMAIVLLFLLREKKKATPLT